MKVLMYFVIKVFLLLFFKSFPAKNTFIKKQHTEMLEMIEKNY